MRCWSESAGEFEGGSGLTRDSLAFQPAQVGSTLYRTTHKPVHPSLLMQRGTEWRSGRVRFVVSTL